MRADERVGPLQEAIPRARDRRASRGNGAEHAIAEPDEAVGIHHDVRFEIGVRWIDARLLGQEELLEIPRLAGDRDLRVRIIGGGAIDEIEQHRCGTIERQASRNCALTSKRAGLPLTGRSTTTWGIVSDTEAMAVGAPR